MASIKRRDDGRWRARYRDESNREHASHFDTKRDAEAWLRQVTADIERGDYVDPIAARETFGEYVARWRAAQIHRAGTTKTVERLLRLHILPTFEDRPIRQVRRSEIQGWVKDREAVLAPNTVAVAFDWMRNIFRAAADDGLIRTSPCRGVKLPRPERIQVVPLSVEQVHALAAAMPGRYRAAVLVGAGTGLRQSELFGLEVDRVDFLRRQVRIDRQLGQDGEAGLVRLKTDASIRTLPITTDTVEVLARHLEDFPAGADGLIFSTSAGPVHRAHAGRVWRNAAKGIGVDERGWHSLRHFYASLLIRYGESVTVVQARLGHATAAETLNTYAHLWPDSEDRTRAAIDAALTLSTDSRGLAADSAQVR